MQKQKAPPQGGAFLLSAVSEGLELDPRELIFN
jgi:hypothetical protein